MNRHLWRLFVYKGFFICYRDFVMSKERLLGDAELDIEVVVKIAKENLLKFGNHVPTVIAVGTDGKGIGQLEGDLGNHEERIRAMRVLGKVFRREGTIGRLQKIFFVSEGWMSVVGKSGGNLLRPSLDPNRIEVLVVSELDLQNQKANMLLFEMLRDEKQNLVEIRQYVDDVAKDGETKSYLLEAFIRGYYSSVAETNGKHLH
ncbi:MAG: hypothetical protein M1347_00705 [Chloroflexi bacterium]|nr:hypothetical protein [Chloroflexota bacterium]